MKIKKFKKVKSTNDIALKLIKQNISQPTLIITDEQTHGRGRIGKKWISKKGNLYMTLFFKVKNYNRIIKLQFDTLKIIKSILLKNKNSKKYYFCITFQKRSVYFKRKDNDKTCCT